MALWKLMAGKRELKKELTNCPITAQMYPSICARNVSQRMVGSL